MVHPQNLQGGETLDMKPGRWTVLAWCPSSRLPHYWSIICIQRVTTHSGPRKRIRKIAILSVGYVRVRD